MTTGEYFVDKIRHEKLKKNTSKMKLGKKYFHFNSLVIPS